MNKQDYQKNKDHWNDIIRDAQKELKRNHDAFVEENCPIKVGAIIENNHARIHVHSIKTQSISGEIGRFWVAEGPKLNKKYELPKMRSNQIFRSTAKISFPTNFEANERCSVSVVEE